MPTLSELMPTLSEQELTRGIDPGRESTSEIFAAESADAKLLAWECDRLLNLILSHEHPRLEKACRNQLLQVALRLYLCGGTDAATDPAEVPQPIDTGGRAWQLTAREEGALRAGLQKLVASLDCRAKDPRENAPDDLRAEADYTAALLLRFEAGGRL